MAVERSAKRQRDATERSAKRQRSDENVSSSSSSAVASYRLQTTENCRHRGFLDGVCLRCCQQVEEEECSSTVDFRYLLQGLRLTSWGISHARKANTARLLQEKKLVLILDLDHTLLHSKHIEEEEEGEEEELLRIKASNPDACLFRLGDIATWTKLRPFVHNFLRGASTMFDMYLYTMGTRSYAAQMAELLDPKGEYFVSKTIAREDSTMSHRKGLDVVLAEESLVLILDDTSHVWEGHGDNLIVMPKYNFFGKFMSEAAVLLEDERKSDGLLATTLQLLKLIHRLFYDPELRTGTQDIREVLRKISQAASARVEEPKSVMSEQSCYAACSL